MGLDYVDLFYSHRFDPETPLEETIGALDTAVRQGKALYVGISSYSAAKTREAAAIARDLGTPIVIHQPSYSMLNRWIEPELLDALEAEGIGCIAFSPLAQGMLTDRYLDGIPPDSRAGREGTALDAERLNEETLAKVRALNEIAAEPRSVTRADGDRLDPPTPARDIGPDRREQRRAAGGERRGARPARLLRRRARRDRPLRDGGRHQPLGPLEQRGELGA